MRADDAALALQFARIAKIDEGDIVVAEQLCGRSCGDTASISALASSSNALKPFFISASMLRLQIPVPATMSRPARFVKVHSNQRSDP